MDVGRPGQPLRARSYAPVARSNSTRSFEQRVSATRWRSDELKSSIPTAPLFDFDPPSRELLDELVREYVAITGDRVERPKKRDLVATCYRVHGPDFIPFVRDFFRAEGSAQNLLGVLRRAPQRHPADDFDTFVGVEPGDVALDAHPRPPHTAMPCPVEKCLPGLIYCADHRPPYDPSSKRRYDRRSPTPDVAPHFAAEDLGR